MLKRDYNKKSDNELLSLIKEKDKYAMDILLFRYKGMVKNKASKMFIAGGDNEDVIQEGMIGLFKAISDYDPDRKGKFSAFAAHCVSSQINDAVKSSSRKKHSLLNSSVPFSKDVSDNGANILETYADISAIDPEEMFISDEMNRSLEKFMKDKLTNIEREALMLFAQGYSYAEIADRLVKTSKSVDTAIQRARKKIDDFRKKTYGEQLK